MDASGSDENSCACGDIARKGLRSLGTAGNVKDRGIQAKSLVLERYLSQLVQTDRLDDKRTMSAKHRCSNGNDFSYSPSAAI